MDEEEPRFGEAMSEVETILEEINSDECDLDDLADRVARAADLIKLCQSKIDRTAFQIESIMETFDGDEE
jgi:exodeoxyribonuclease VII small subunit